MPDLYSLATLDEVVSEYMLMSEIPQAQYTKLKQLAIRGYRSINLNISPEGKNIVKKTMTDNDIIPFPDDLHKLTNVSIADEYGVMWTLSRNQNITPTTTELNGQEIRSTDNNEGENVLHRSGYGFDSRGGINTEGYYTVDYKKRRILFSNVTRSEVLLDYISDGINMDGETYVPKMMLRTIHAYMSYYYYLHRIDSSESKVERFKQELREAKAELRGMYFNFTAFKDMIYRNFTATVNR